MISEPLDPISVPCAGTDIGMTEEMSMAVANCPPDLNAQNLIVRALQDPLITEPSPHWPSGIPIHWEPGWRERRWCAYFAPRGLVIHHTGSNYGYREDYPTMAVIKNGNGTVPGPLAQFGLGRSGKIYVIAAGHANHAGANSEGSWNPSGRPGEGLVSNVDVWGIEAENDGLGQAWSPAQLDAYHRLAAALARATRFAPEMICAHREWRPRKFVDKYGNVWAAKTDPVGIDAVRFRSEVSDLLVGIAPPIPPPPPAAAGNWVEKYGATGFCLAAWNLPSDHSYFPRQVLSELQLRSGVRYSWGPTTDSRALEAPDRTSRRATTFYHDTQLVVSLHFAGAYTGTLHLYMLDWDRRNRRQVVKVEDERGVEDQSVTVPFDDGVWLHFPISVGAGGTSTITIDKLSDAQALLSGIFLGDEGPPPLPDRAPQGDWVGVYGADGFCLGGWDVSKDFSYFQRTVLTRLELVRGWGYSWGPTTHAKALESPDQSTRRSTTFADDSRVVVALHFAGAYTGTLHLYMLDWDRRGRRQTVAVDCGAGPTVERVTLPFDEGVWLHFPISVGAGGTSTITIDKLSDAQALLSGIFLGDEGPPPLPDRAPQGDWVGVYGADGFCLAGWDVSNDLSYFQRTVLTRLELVQGWGYSWGPTTHAKALESPDQSTRRSTTFADDSRVVVALHFADAYTGILHLYMLDWDRRGRRQTVAVDCGAGPTVERVTLPFDEGVWLHFPISVGAGGTSTITVHKLSDAQALLSGIFLGDEGPPPLPDRAPQGDWVGVYGADGFCLAGWDVSNDLSSFPHGVVTLVDGFRHSWGPTTHAKALESPDQSTRRATTFADDTQVVVDLQFANEYKGTLHLYMLDWDRRGRRQTVAVDCGAGPTVERVTLPFEDGVWLHFPISVGAGGIANITVHKLSDAHALLSGIFLG